MTTLEQIVENAKAAGERTILLKVEEEDADRLLAQSTALGVKSYKFFMAESEYAAMLSRFCPINAVGGGTVDLSQREIDALIARNGLPPDTLATHPMTILFFVL